MLKAWGDESKSSHRRDPGTYIFGAVITDGKEAENDARDVLKQLLLPGQRKTHWRDESDKRRDQIIEVIGECGLDGIVVTRVGTVDERDERQRRKCFEYFALQLIANDIWDLCLESRGATGNALDLEMVNALRAAKIISPEFRIDHAGGATDPLLWAADAVCGAVVSSRIGEPKWLHRLERIVQFEMSSRPA